jgi:hypothetical protein
MTSPKNLEIRQMNMKTSSRIPEWRERRRTLIVTHRCVYRTGSYVEADPSKNRRGGWPGPGRSGIVGKGRGPAAPGSHVCALIAHKCHLPAAKLILLSCTRLLVVIVQQFVQCPICVRRSVQRISPTVLC